MSKIEANEGTFVVVVKIDKARCEKMILKIQFYFKKLLMPEM